MNKDVQTVAITVDGGYQPHDIVLTANQVTQLNFTRVSDKGCLDVVQSSDLKFKEPLPLNQTVTVTLSPLAAGTYEFSCGMNMVKGKVVVQP